MPNQTSTKPRKRATAKDASTEAHPDPAGVAANRKLAERIAAEPATIREACEQIVADNEARGEAGVPVDEPTKASHDPRALAIASARSKVRKALGKLDEAGLTGTDTYKAVQAALNAIMDEAARLG